jgi:hydrophobe/amphiphile efflux-3 (HAE3) family protein
VEKFWSNLAVQLGKRIWLVAGGTLAITAVMVVGLGRLEFATGQDSYLNSDDQVAIDNVAYQDLFGGQIMITLFTMDEGSDVVDLVTGDNRDQIIAAHEEVLASENVEAAISPITALEFSNNLIQRSYGTPESPEVSANPLETIAGRILGDAITREEEGSPEAAARAADQSRTACRLLGATLDGSPCDEPGIPAEERVLENPEWVRFLLFDNQGEIRKSLRSFFPDPTHAQMITRLKGNASLEVEGEGALDVKAAWADKEIEGAELTVTGAPVLLKDINDYLRGGILQLGALAVVIMMVVLLVLFDVRWRLLPLGVILLGVTWAFGLAGFLGIPLSVVTIAGLPVMLGVGIDYAIQMHARVEEEVIIDRAEHPIQETSRQLGPALLVVTISFLFAFAALYFAKVPMIRAFGLLLSVGIVVICLVSIIIPLAVLGAREYRRPTKGRDYREGRIGRAVVRLGSAPTVVAIPLIVASGAIFLGGLAVEGELELQTDPVQWVNQESQNRKDVATLEREVDSSSELGIYLTTEDRERLFSDEMAAFVHEFTAQQLAEYPDQLLRASSIFTPISYLTEIEGASDLPPTGEQVAAVYAAAPDQVQRFTVATDEPAMNVLFTTRPGSLDDRSVMVADIRENTEPPEGIRATPSGLAVVGVGLVDNLESNRAQLTYLSLGLVFLFLLLRLRGFVRALLAMVPVVIATGAASLVAFALDLKLSPMTAVGGPLIIAMCTEFTALILLRFIEERERGLSPQASSDVAAARTGRAFIVSALTSIVGVAVIATSSLPILRDFGTIVAMNVTVALLSALVVLPPLIVWAEQRGWVTRGLVDPSKLGDKAHDEAYSKGSMVPGAPEVGPERG